MRIRREILENLQALINDNIDDCVTDVIESFIDDQPYSCECNNCGKDVYWTKKTDKNGDIYLTVEPCSCLLNEYIEENKEMHKEK